MTWHPRHTRLLLIALALLGAGIAVALVLTGLQEKVTYFYSPSEIAAKQDVLLAQKKNIRLGGLVETGSITRKGTHVIFVVTDLKARVIVHYTGLTPDLFREGKGVVAEGVLQTPGLFMAQTLLAKHDENYMPPEVAKILPKGAGGTK